MENKKLLNEELNKMKHLMGYQYGSINESVILNEGLVDWIKDKVGDWVDGLVDKLGDKGEEVYNNLVSQFGESPTIDDVKSKLKSQINEDRFDDLALGADPKYSDKEGEQNMVDKVMGVINRVAGINLASFGIIPTLIITKVASIGAFTGGPVVLLASIIISSLIMKLTNMYGRKRDLEQ